MPSLLEARGLTASYGATQVLHGIDFAVEAGRITALLGANGAGKTTTLRAICQMVRSGGTLTFDGHALTGLATEDIVRLGVAHVPDGRGTFTALTVEENLRLGTPDFHACVSADCSRQARSQAASSRCSRSRAR